MKALKATSLLNISIYSVLLAVLFKPGSEVGMYDWLVRPSYIIQILNFIFTTSMIIFLLSSSLFLLKFFKNATFNRKIFRTFAIYFLFFFLLQFISFITDGQSLVSFIFRIVVMLVILLVIVNFFQLRYNKVFYLWPIAITGGIFVVFNMMLLYIDPLAVWPNSIYGRMYGTTEHPNFFAMICAVTSMVVFELIRNFQSLNIVLFKKVRYSVLMIILALSLLGIVFSGSRTALLFVVFGVFLSIYSLYKSINGKVLFLFMILLLSLSIFSFFDLILNVEGLRITSTENNRSGAWNAMLSIFINNPLFGVGLQNVGYSENSYLRALAATGLAGIWLFLIFVFKVIYRAASNLKNKEFRSFSIFVLALLFTAISEGFLMDSFSFILIVFLYSVGAIFSFKKGESI